MDKKNHNDWTGAVRERLESRELTPSDALWERIGAAMPQAGAPRKVRRLAWGGAIGAAAAAALAAVLFLRPAGAPEDGRIDVVPTPAAPLAEQRVVQEPEFVAEPEAVRELKAYAQPKAIARPEIIAEQKSAAEQPVAEPFTDRVPVTAVGHPETAAQNAHDIPDAKQNVQNAKNVQPVQAVGEPAMTIDEYIAQDDAKRRHRSFTAALFAAGMPTRVTDYSQNGSFDKLILFNYNDFPKKDRNSAQPQGSLANYADLSTSSNDPDGITYNPENPNGYEPVKYANDPYNLSGERLNHFKPVNAGIAITLPVDKHLFVESGIYYSYMRSTSYQVSNQSLHSLGIPLKLGWRLDTSRHTSLSFSAGAKAEKCLLALRDGARSKEPGIQLAAVGNAAVQYDFTPRLGIFLAPELSYWFTETKLPTYNTEHPFNLSLKAGLNLTVGR